MSISQRGHTLLFHLACLERGNKGQLLALSFLFFSCCFLSLSYTPFSLDSFLLEAFVFWKISEVHQKREKRNKLTSSKDNDLNPSVLFLQLNDIMNLHLRILWETVWNKMNTKWQDGLMQKFRRLKIVIAKLIIGPHFLSCFQFKIDNSVNPYCRLRDEAHVNKGMWPSDWWELRSRRL